MVSTLFRFFSLLVLVTLPMHGLLAVSPIDIHEAKEIGGIKQWISIQGDERNPILLFLHGGPGNSAMSYAQKFTGQLQKYFLVVQWDQRQSGKTARLNTRSKRLTVELMESDAVEMIWYLCSRFSQKKIYLMGHSWGGFLALRMAMNHPDLLESCFAISPMVNQLESEYSALEWMQGKSKELDILSAANELGRVKIPFEDGDQLFYHRKWLAFFSGSEIPTQAFVNRWARQWLTLFNQASSVNFFETATTINCPVYFFVGSNDRLTYSKITEDYYKKVKAEKKDLFWFTNSGHNLNLTEPEKLQRIIIALRKP